MYLRRLYSGRPALSIATASALIFALVMTLTAYGFGGNLILASVGAESLDIKVPEHRELHNVVTEMALASGCPMPKVHTVYDPAPNAFATGRDEKSSAICVTTGLLALLDREETQGVVAHEMAHIKNRRYSGDDAGERAARRRSPVIGLGATLFFSLPVTGAAAAEIFSS